MVNQRALLCDQLLVLIVKNTHIILKLILHRNTHYSNYKCVDTNNLSTKKLS